MRTQCGAWPKPKPRRQRKNELKKGFIIALSAVFLLSSTCPAENVVEQTLPSGNTVKIKGITKIHFTKGAPALALEYETGIDIADVDALRRQAEEIWPVFRVNVEREKMDNAALKASAPKTETGPITYRYSSYSFIVTRKKNGTWHMNNWGRDYEKEESLIADAFLSALQHRDILAAADSMHIPGDYTGDQAEAEIRGLSTILDVLTHKLGQVTAIAPNDTPIRYKYFALQSASREYWQTRPVFNALIYDVTYANAGKGYLIFRFSIVDQKTVIHSLLFGLPEDNPESGGILEDLNDSVMKALNG
jgi:hypothetical protein